MIKVEYFFNFFCDPLKLSTTFFEIVKSPQEGVIFRKNERVAILESRLLQLELIFKKVEGPFSKKCLGYAY